MWDVAFGRFACRYRERVPPIPTFSRRPVALLLARDNRPLSLCFKKSALNSIEASAAALLEILTIFSFSCHFFSNGADQR